MEFVGLWPLHCRRAATAVDHLHADKAVGVVDRDIEVGGGVEQGVGRQFRNHDGHVIDRVGW